MFCFSYHERISVYASSVGPLHNSAEVYSFYSLPFCQPTDLHVHDASIGEQFAGERKQISLYDLRFKVDTQWQSICTMKLTQDHMKLFRDAIKRDYMFELYVDGLPVRGFVGEVVQDELDREKQHYFLFPHLEFSVAVNGDRVIAVNVSADPSQRIELEYGKDLKIDFSFSTRFWDTSVTFDNRFELHSKWLLSYDSDVEIHWLSIINSIVLVLLLTVFLAFILMRVLKNDLTRYLDVDVDDAEVQGDLRDESGWKMVRGDVFRAPDYLLLFTAAVGTGIQLLVILVAVLFLAVVGIFYHSSRGSMYSAGIVLYCLTTYIAGYVSCQLYLQLGGDKWATNAIFTSLMYAGPFFSVFGCVNSVAMYYKSSTALPLFTVFTILAIWVFVSLPLTIFGAMYAKKNAKLLEPPCKVNRVEREIPPFPWYRTLWVQLFVAGFLPFTAIYIELHYMFSAIWGHHVYTVFEILAISFVLLLIVTSCVSIALTYLQLAIEDHKWWWKSFLSGGAAGVFIFLYGWYFFTHRSAMEGFLQASFFFGYLFLASYGFVLMLGAVGFLSSYRFVFHIYNSIKAD